MANQVYSYDPASVAIIAGGAIMQGFTDGTFVTIERNADMYALKIGCDGQGTRARSNNYSGRVTVTLQQSSASNDKLSAYAVADETLGTGVFPLLVRDGSGRTIASALTAWVVKLASQEFGKETGDRVWVLETDNLQLFGGGN